MSHEQIIDDDDDDDLWLSGHRSIFSSDGNDQHVLSFGQSQYDGFHWDCLVEHRDHYHQLTFEDDSRLSEWSMRFTSDQSDNDDETTTSTSSSIDHRRISWKDIRKRSSIDSQRQHPCRFYQNFSDKSQTDSSISFKLPRLITFSQLRNIDRSLQTSFKSSTTNNDCRDRSLPDLSFLQYYAKENPRSFASKTCQTEEIETLSSTCSSSENSTSSSGYSSSTTNPRRLKSCLKRQKSFEVSCPMSVVNVLAGGLAGDILTLTRRKFDSKNTEKRSSMPIFPAHIQKQPTDEWILSENDLRTKKSVSFGTDIVRRLIPSTSNIDFRTRFSPDDCDFVPRETFNESPPNEFQFECDEDENDSQPMNFIETIPEDLPKPLAKKYPTDRFLIDAFSKTILRILEIKCNDPKAFYLNNLINDELDRTLRQELCPLLYEVLDDGLRRHSSSSLFSKKIHLWRLIDFTTPNFGQINEAKNRSQLAVPSAHESFERFSAFVFHLLNFQQLANWFAEFLSHRNLFETYYERSALLLNHYDDDLFERLTNQLEKLSPLSFRLKYSQRSSSTTKKFNVRLWLRDRKTQVKLTPKQLHSQRLRNAL